ncbi:unnamed protein product [Ilex paraguariensis]|uniref:Bulb-type lectin domain-containing protein n=1 Tax=Ilex paraguariensis TaxID=185542 RepID=A0ABC8TJU5_9AQUA
MDYFILFFVLPYFFSVCSAQPPPSISKASTIFYLNSSLPWYNNTSTNMTLNGDDGSKLRVVLSSRNNPTANMTPPNTLGFVCGFYCIDSCNEYLFSLAVVGADIPSVVWSANRDHPVQENATLQLTGDGDLVLRNSNGTKVWSTNTAGTSAQELNISASGNLVLLSDKRDIVWQSFDHPTDTLLNGQRLNEGQRLTVSASKSNWTRGLYYATLTSASGFATYTKVDQGPPLMYYQLVPNQSLSSSSSDRFDYAESTRGGLLVNLGTSQEIFGKTTVYRHDSYIEYLRLDSDGHLKIYQYDDARGFNEVLDLVSNDLGVCQYPRRCGEYGVCREGECTCPLGQDRVQYFDQSRLQLPNQGCSRITPLSCQPSPDKHKLVEVKYATYFNVIDSAAALPNIQDINGCREACLKDCSCGAIFFRYDNISNGYCFMPPEILSIREGQIPNHNFMTTTYIKKKNEDDEEDYIRHVPGLPMRFSYEELRIATEDFKERLGSGGFGTVFRGMLGDVCGRKNLDHHRSESSSHLLSLLQKAGKEDKLLDIVEHLEKGMEDHREEMVSMIKIAAWCLQDDHKRRPSMSTVVKVLEGVIGVDPDISYNFSHAKEFHIVVEDHASTPPQASALSGPR